MLSRVAKISLGRKNLATPAYFPAVSSAAVGYPANALIRLMVATKYPRLLVSAYDTHRISTEGNTEMLSQLGQFSMQGSFLLLDSGVFESYWKGDKTWTFESYAKAVSEVRCDLYYSFDVFPDLSKSEQDFFAETCLRIMRSCNVSDSAQCIPILHGPSPQQLVAVVERFVQENPDRLSMVAVSEKDCGFTLLQRARTMAKIRKVLDSKNDENILHILGCGNPISILLYSYCGADTYDSPDWSRHVINRKDFGIADLAHLELLRCDCTVCKKKVGTAAERALLHNLLFYQDFTIQIQNMIRDHSIGAVLSDRVGGDLLSSIEKEGDQ
jgi:queuine/archaeosine tRNA-ribosyltransferase